MTTSRSSRSATTPATPTSRRLPAIPPANISVRRPTARIRPRGWSASPSIMCGWITKAMAGLASIRSSPAAIRAKSCARTGANASRRSTRSRSRRTTPVPMTHRFFGRSIADLVMPLQREKTALKRGALDNLYLHNNPRVEVSEANAGPNTLDDLLVSRPGGVVRTKTAGRAELAGGARYHLVDLSDDAVYRRRARDPHRPLAAIAGHRRQRAAEPVGDGGGAGVLGLANARSS